MTPARWQRIKSILADALEHSEPASRTEFVTRACGGDAELLRDVQSFLAQQTEGLEKFANQSNGFTDEPAGPTNAGRRIGAYQLLRELGRGGMGAVWLAQRADHHFEQQVAIKLLKRGTDTEEVLRRFRAERQILARLEHPGIARLFDGGETDDGLPFFVLEYVSGGETLTAFAEQHALPVRARLELFRKVCAAVQFAHQNLVVHRDLKPGNILITPEGEPKLLDFGIAKLLAPGEDAWDMTIAGGERLTLGYASPEQLRGEPVTTVSDVYALGALLYEILCGTRPHPVPTGRSPSAELLRTICEQPPPRPSLVARTPELRRQLRGDLDTIVLRALSATPQRRYASAGNLGDDLRRHLEGRTVRARPDTFGYRARKFVGRNKTGSVAAAVVIVTLVVGVIVTGVEARIARRERAHAERRFRELRRLANSFLFELDDAIKTRPTTARQLLVQRAREYLDSLMADAGADRSLQRELAAAYQKLGDVGSQLNQANIGDTAGAIASYRKSLALREQLFDAGSEDPTLRLELALSYRRLGDMLAKTGNTTAAMESYRKTVPLLEQDGGTMNSATRLALASDYEIIGRTLFRTGDYPAATAQYQKALELIGPLVQQQPVLPAALLEQGKSFTSLAYLLGQRGRNDEALSYYRKALETVKAAAALDPENTTIRRRLMDAHECVGTGLRDAGALNAALLEYAEAQTSCEQALRADPANVQTRNDLADIFHNIGQTRYLQHDAAGALRDYRIARDLYRSVAASDAVNVHAERQVLIAQKEVGEAFALSGDRAAAFAELRESAEGLSRLAAQDAADREFQEDEVSAEADLGELLASSGDRKGAEEHLRRALPIVEALAALSPSDAKTQRELERVRGALAAIGQPATPTIP